MRMTWICFFFNSNSHFLHTSEFSLCFLHTYFTGWQIASVKDGRSGCFQNKVILLEILLVRCPLWHPTLIHWHLSFNLLDLRGQATIKSRNAGEALLTRSATSVSLGYQAPPWEGYTATGVDHFLGRSLQEVYSGAIPFEVLHKKDYNGMPSFLWLRHAYLIYWGEEWGLKSSWFGRKQPKKGNKTYKKER